MKCMVQCKIAERRNFVGKHSHGNFQETKSKIRKENLEAFGTDRIDQEKIVDKGLGAERMIQNGSEIFQEMIAAKRFGGKCLKEMARRSRLRQKISRNFLLRTAGDHTASDLAHDILTWMSTTLHFPHTVTV